jgi:hypothetical protein
MSDPLLSLVSTVMANLRGTLGLVMAFLLTSGTRTRNGLDDCRGSERTFAKCPALLLVLPQDRYNEKNDERVTGSANLFETSNRQRRECKLDYEPTCIT